MMAYLFRRHIFFAGLNSSNCTELFAKVDSRFGLYVRAEWMAVFHARFVRDTSLFGYELCVVGEELESFGKEDIEL